MIQVTDQLLKKLREWNKGRHCFKAFIIVLKKYEDKIPKDSVRGHHAVINQVDELRVGVGISQLNLYHYDLLDTPYAMTKDEDLECDWMYVLLLHVKALSVKNLIIANRHLDMHLNEKEPFAHHRKRLQK